MNKKALMLLPFAGMLLASCGKTNTKLPKGYTAVDITNPEAVQKYADKLVENIKTTYKSLRENGISLDLNAGLESLTQESYNFDYGKVYRDETTKITNGKLSANIKACGLDKDIRSWKASADVTSLGVKVEHDDKTEFNEDVNFEFKGAEFGVVFAEDTLMVDLSSKKLRKAIASVIDGASSLSEKEKEEYKTYIPTIAQKFMGKGLLKAAGLIPDESQEVPESEEVPFKYFTLPAELPEEALADISTTVVGLMTILGAEEFKTVRDAFTFAEYKDGRLGLGVAGNIGALFGFKEEEKLDVDAMVLFNKKGELESIAADIDYNMVDNYTYDNGTPDDPTDDEIDNDSMELKLSLDVSVSYNVKDIKLPNDKDYKKLPLNLIAAM